MNKNTTPIVLLLIAIIFIGACSKDASIATGTTGKSGSTAQFVIANNFMYLLHNSNVDVYNITNAAQPVFTKTIAVGSGSEALFPYNNKLFIAGNTGVLVYNITDGANPTYLYGASHFTGCDPVVVNDSCAFVTIHGGSSCRSTNINELQIYKYSNNDFSSMYFLASVAMVSPYGLALDNNILYVCDKGAGIKIFDVSNPSSPQIKATFAGNNYQDLIVMDNELFAYTTDGLEIFDKTDPITLIKKGEVKN